MTSYYVDACIYLNLWKEEKEGLFGKNLGKIAQKFFKNTEIKSKYIYYSGFLLKELSYKLTEREFNRKKILFESTSNFIKVYLNPEEHKQASRIEQELQFEISFFDIIHLLLARKTNSILVTRDKKLLEIAKKFRINAKKPEDIIHQND